jgi:hypothetical protein
MRISAIAVLASGLLALGLLEGCASPKIDLAVAGAGPDKASGYRLAAPIDPDAPEDRTVLPLVEARLKALGLTRVDRGARYVLELAVSQRPIAVASAPGLAPANAPKDAPPDWLSAPGKHRWWVSNPETICQLSVRLVDVGSGREAYRVRAALQGDAPDCSAVTPRLVAVALSQAPLPPGETQIP